MALRHAYWSLTHLFLARVAGLTLFHGTALSAQTPAERHFLDSLLVTVADAQPGLNLPTPTICAKQVRPMQRLCEALLVVRQWKIPIIVPEVRPYLFAGIDPPHHNDGTPIMRRSALNARTQIGFVLFERPKWAPPYFVLAQIVLSDFEVDSALSLLHTARNFPGMAPGVVDLAIARAEFARGDRTAGWQAFLHAASDTSAVSQAFMERMLARYLLANVVAEWKGKTVVERTEWLQTRAGVQLTLGDGLSFFPVFSVRTRSYGEERDGGRFVAAFSVPTYDLLGDTLLVPGKKVFPVRVRLVAWRQSDGMEVSLDTTRFFSAFVPPALRPQYLVDPATGRTPQSLCPAHIPCEIFQIPRPPVQWLAAYTELPLLPGRWSLTLTLSQANDHRGVTVLLPDADIPVAEPAQLTMTDLILGANESTLNWPSATQPVPMNPHGEWVRDIPMTIYTQLSGLSVGDYGVQIRFTSLDPKQVGGAKGTITFSLTEKATASKVVFFREASLKQLTCGPYRVEVMVSQGSQHVSHADVMRVDC